MIWRWFSLIVSVDFKQFLFLVLPTQIPCRNMQIPLPFFPSHLISQSLTDCGRDGGRLMVFDEQTKVVLSDNLLDLRQMRSHNRHTCLDEIEEFVGKAETIVEVGVLIEAEAQLGELRIGHHLLVRHTREETHAVGNLQVFNHLFQDRQHIPAADNH